MYEAVVRRTAEGLKSERVMRGIKAQVIQTNCKRLYSFYSFVH